MRAAFLSGPGEVLVRDFPMPQADAPGDMVIRLHRAAICGSDLHLFADGGHVAPGPGYPGHEGIGEVVESRSPQFNPGDLVLAVPLASSEGGCFAEYLVIDDAHAILLPPGSNEAELLMAQQLGTTVFALDLFWPESGNTGGLDTVAIIGAGAAGLNFVQLVKRLGFRNILVSDLSESRLAVARQLGATSTAHAPHSSIVDAVMDVTSGQGADLVIEAAGYDECRQDAIEAIKFRGTVGYFGYPGVSSSSEHSTVTAFRKAVRLQWASGTQSEAGLVSFREAIRLIGSGELSVAHLQGPVFSLEDIAHAVSTAHSREALKVAIGFAP